MSSKKQLVIMVLLFVLGTFLLVCPVVADNRVIINPQVVHVVVTEGNYVGGYIEIINNKNYAIDVYTPGWFGHGGDIHPNRVFIEPGERGYLEWNYFTYAGSVTGGPATPPGEYCWTLPIHWQGDCGSDCYGVGGSQSTIHLMVVPKGSISVSEFSSPLVPISLIGFLVFLIIFRHKRNI